MDQIPLVISDKLKKVTNNMYQHYDDQLVWIF